MLAHAPRHATTNCHRISHIAAVGDMVSAARLIGTKIIGANDAPTILRNEGFTIRSHPIGQRVRFAHVAGQDISLSGADRRFDYRPNGSLIIFSRRPDQHVTSMNGSGINTPRTEFFPTECSEINPAFFAKAPMSVLSAHRRSAAREALWPQPSPRSRPPASAGAGWSYQSSPRQG